MKHKSELISDDNNIEILVGYDYEIENGYFAEASNPSTWVEPTVSIELTSVEVVIAGKGIDILPLLSNKQHHFITDKLTCND